ncbi:hypothetical protein HX746_30325, partial [Rhodococcus erythropolis]|nr:hypothetical protein [Rhodococcus erythropolis]
VVDGVANRLEILAGHHRLLRIGTGSGSLRSPPGSRCAARSGPSQAAVDRLAPLL